MTTVYDVPADRLLPRLAEKLKETGQVAPPKWSQFVKTGRHRERQPVQPNWWFVRTAAVLRKIYIMGPVGTNRLTARFGGVKDRGSKPNMAWRGSGSIAREAMAQLEGAGLVTVLKGRGRVVTPKGRSFLDNTAYEVLKELVPSRPDLARYAGGVKQGG